MSEPVELPEEDEAMTQLREVIGGWLIANQLEGGVPLVSAANLFGVLVDVLDGSMGRLAIRSALMMVFEKTYDEPMTFMQRSMAKELLDKLSHARRQVEGKPHLVMPDKGDLN